MSSMSSPHVVRRFLAALLIVLSMTAAMRIAWAGQGAAAPVGPSDCRARDADSTCATAVAGASSPTQLPSGTLYDGPLAGVPNTGYSYWGYDFIADATGTPSPVRPDEFINRSGVPVSITLTFTVPASPTCWHDCLPGVEFEIGPGWYKVDPPQIRNVDTLTVTTTIRPFEGYAWIIGPWQATNPRVRVTVPQGSSATLADVGLPATFAVSTEIPAVVHTCACADGTVAECSDGGRYSNGLLGTWDQHGFGYTRPGLFSNCPEIH